MIVSRASVCLLVVAAAACGPGAPTEVTRETASGERSSAFTILDPERLTPEQTLQARHAALSRDQLMSRLMEELTAAIDAGGPDAAIEVCHRRAPEIADAVADENGVEIGRTSFRLRNPRNSPPSWAEGLVTERRSEPAFLEGPDGSLAALYPIRLKAGCTMCHGTDAEIPDEVAARLAELYPDDRATGFAEGDLRGWLWVEVPAHPAPVAS
jgi:hypothetical protein